MPEVGTESGLQLLQDKLSVTICGRALCCNAHGSRHLLLTQLGQVFACPNARFNDKGCVGNAIPKELADCMLVIAGKMLSSSAAVAAAARKPVPLSVFLAQAPKAKSATPSPSRAGK